MIVETLVAIGVGSAVTTVGASLTAFLVNQHRYANSEWAKITGNSFLKHCYKKYLQLNKAARKGYAGEHEISQQLEKVRGERKLLFNVLIPAGKDKTTEIDALMIHESGVYVIENKNYTGTIGNFLPGKKTLRSLGNVNPYKEKWDVVYGTNTIREMKNPVLQNEAHLYCLKRLLSHLHISHNRFFSIVTFNSNGKVKGAPFDFNISSEGRMLMSKHLANELNCKISQRSRILTSQKMNSIYSILEPFSRVSVQERKEHISRVNQQSIKENDLDDKQTEHRFVPLNDVIRSAENKEQAQPSRDDHSMMKNYMNMFRS